MSCANSKVQFFNPLFLSPISFRFDSHPDPEHIVGMSRSEETAEDEIGAEYRSG